MIFKQGIADVITLAQKAAASGVASLNASSKVVQEPADRLSVNNLKFTLNKLVKGAGSTTNPTEIDVPNAGLREVFARCQSGVAMEQMGSRVSQAGDYGTTGILIPNLTVSITSVEVIFLPDESAASMHFDYVTYFGNYNGQAFNIHSETGAARDIGATVANQYKARDITDLCTGLAAGDILYVRVAYNATAVDSNAHIIGIRIVWA
uniref:Uncharacterized protein n=2 Tax=viral metagenome TaxID=1070528 RepID=A0A6M3KFY3_9ZZZZ